MSLFDHVAPSIYQEVDKSQEGDLNCKEAGPKAHALGGSLMVRAEASVDVCDASGANCDAEKPVEEEPQAPAFDTSVEIEQGFRFRYELCMKHEKVARWYRKVVFVTFLV